MIMHADKTVEQEETHQLLLGMQTCIIAMEIIVVIPQGDKN